MRFFLFFLMFYTFPLLAQDKLELELQKGIDAFEKEKFAKAERIFDKLLAKEASYPEVYIWKAKCLIEFEEFQEAYEALQTASNLEPTHAPYWVEMGIFKHNLGLTSIRRPELCGDCGKLILPHGGQTLKATDYYNSAIKDFEKAIQLDSNNKDAYFELAQLYLSLNDKIKVCELLQTASRLKHSKAIEQIKKNCP